MLFVVPRFLCKSADLLSYVTDTAHLTNLQTIVKKASAMLDGHSTIHRAHKLYYAYLTKNSGSSGPALVGE